jgi:ABC-type phosphate transport system permease subunit
VVATTFPAAAGRGTKPAGGAVIIVSAIAATIFSLIVLCLCSGRSSRRAGERAVHLPEQRVHQPEHAAGYGGVGHAILGTVLIVSISD